MPQEQKHYYAFISHSTTDEKIALWLRKELEGYHIPSAVQRDYHAPKRLRPVFIYQTDLAGTQLGDALDQSLADSQYLIVICSPSAAQSSYVNNEVQHFIDTGRADKIIPFIVSGTPYASQKGNSSDECFPPALISLKEKGQESRGINLSEMTEKNGSKMSAVVNVIASMLGVRYDVLWDRYQRRQRKIQIAVAIGVFLLCLVGLFIWDYTRPTYRYFADYVDKWGVPEGIIELSKEQQRHRHRMYQFEYRRIPFGESHAYSWRVIKVSYVNSAKQVQEITHTEQMDRYPIQKIEYYKQTGDVAKLVYCDIKENVLLRHVLSERNGQKACIADFVDAQEQRGTASVGANLNSMFVGQMSKYQQKSNIVRFVYERDENGYITHQTYHANNDYNISNSAVSDKGGIFGRAFVLDSLGRRVSVDYLGLNGDRACTRSGVAGRRYEYDELGNIHKVTYVNLQGNPTFNEDCWAVCVDVSDDRGNCIEWAFYGTNGKPCLCIDHYAKMTRKYDDQGNCIECAYYGKYGQPCMFHTDGYFKETAKYDDRGNCIEWACYGRNGKLCLCIDHYAKEIAKYDDRGNRIECAYYGTDGQPCLCEGGYAKMTQKYDDRGNCVERACYGIDGQPCMMKCYEKRYSGLNGQPCICKTYYAKKTQKYDDRGNKIETAYFGIDGQPCLCNDDSYAKMTQKYDDRGNCIEWAFYGIDGQPCMWKCYEELYSGLNGQPSLCHNGYTKATAKYDDRGNCVEWACYGIDGQLCLCHDDSYAKMTQKYDDRGNCIEWAFYGIDGQPCLCKGGYAKEVYKYDERGYLIEDSYYGTDGKPCLCDKGYARMTLSYDDQNKIEVKYFDVEGNNIAL